jgi:hypothetical protein
VSSPTLSFPGEHRTVVEAVTELLATDFTRQRVLYDHYPRVASDLDNLASLFQATGHPDIAHDFTNLTGLLHATNRFAEAEPGWTASTETTLKHYQVRFCSGPECVAAEEETIASILPGAPLVLLTPAGLSVAGATASYKVYVVLEAETRKAATRGL